MTMIKDLLVFCLMYVTDSLISLIEVLEPDIFEENDPEDNTSNQTKIWGVVDGPFRREDFPQEELNDPSIPEDAEAMVVAKVEENGKIGQVNLWVSSFNEAYEICKYFDDNIEPLILKK